MRPIDLSIAALDCGILKTMITPLSAERCAMKTRITVQSFTLFVGFILFAVGCGPSPTPRNQNDNTDAQIPMCDDEDGDGICDTDEGRAENIDTDGDGTPDYLDQDSDGDGINDSIEAGTTPGSPPIDSDGDGTADFRDDDSDGNGIPDAQEGTGDTDGDGILNFADQDDDGDTLVDVIEIGPDVQNPTDTDGDGNPDYRDNDADGDNISDRHESGVDSDADGTPNFQDTDADGDGILDENEAGDTDLSTPPVDTDGDGDPDFLDLDSDNDGLADALEIFGADGQAGTGDETDPTQEDTDGDGVSDLIEYAAGTNPNDANDNPRENGDFVFLEPYEEPPEPEEDRLAFSTTFKSVDIYILEDKSGSMQEEISSIKLSLITMIEDVTCGPGEDPAVDYCIPDVESGCGRFGQSSETWANLQSISSDHNATQSALPSSAHGGNEQHIQAMHGAITGNCGTDPNRYGTACFRPGSLGIIVLVSDEDYREDDWYGTQNAQSTYDEMANLGTRVVGVTGNDDYNERDELRQDMLAMSGGNPAVQLVPPISSIPPTPQCNALGAGPFFQDRAIVNGPDTQAANAMTCAIQAITAYLPQDVYTVIVNDPGNVDANGDPVDAVAAFVDHIEVFQDGSAECSDGHAVSDSTGNGFNDQYDDILPGTPVCWKLFVKQNDTVEPSSEEPLMFTATVEVHGEGGALLDERDVYFLVPPVIEGPILE